MSTPDDKLTSLTEELWQLLIDTGRELPLDENSGVEGGVAGDVPVSKNIIYNIIYNNI